MFQKDNDKLQKFIISKHRDGSLMVLDYPDEYEDYFIDVGDDCYDAGFNNFHLLEDEGVGAYEVTCRVVFDDGSRGIFERVEAELFFNILTYKKH